VNIFEPVNLIAENIDKGIVSRDNCDGEMANLHYLPEARFGRVCACGLGERGNFVGGMGTMRHFAHFLRNYVD
jgi:hypothetical protein